MTYYSLADEATLHETPEGASLMIRSALSLNDPNLIVVNPTARNILRLSDGSHTAEEIAQVISTEFSVDVSQVRHDVKEFLQEAVNGGLVKEHTSQSPHSVRQTGDPNYHLPQHVMVELTKDCNLECVHCYRGSGREKFPRMSTEKLLDTLSKFKNIGVRVVELTGGEPLMHPDFFKIVDFVGDTFESFAIVSNGALWTQRHVEHIAKYRSKVTVQIDLDGPNAVVHQKVRVTPGTFERSVGTIKQLKAVNVRVRAAMNVLPETLPYVEETMQLAQSLGVDWFAFAPIQELGRARNLDLLYTEEQGQTLTRLAKKLPEANPDFVSHHSEFTLKTLSDTGNCGAGYRSVVLSPTGTVRPCVMFPEDVMVMGDVTQQDVRDVFRTPFTNFMHDLHTPGPDCDPNCPDLKQCQGCYARSIAAQVQKGSSCSWAEKTGFSRFFSPDISDMNSTVVR